MIEANISVAVMSRRCWGRVGRSVSAGGELAAAAWGDAAGAVVGAGVSAGAGGARVGAAVALNDCAAAGD